MKLVTPMRIVAVSCAAVSFALPVARGHAQEPRRLATPDSVPLELAAALASAGGFSTEPQILVGSMPEWITNRLYVPAGARVLGSAFLGTTVVAVVSLAAASDSVIPEFKRELLQRGWKAPPPAPTFAGGGFRPAPPPTTDALVSRVTLCTDEQTLTASAARRRGTSTSVTFRVTGSTTYGICRPPQMPSPMIRTPFPTLVNPSAAADARMTGDCSSTIAGAMSINTTLRTSIPAESLLVHYGRQLVDSGWTAAGERASLLGRAWTRPDSAGAPVETMITVTTPERDPGCREVTLQVRTLRKR